MDELELNKALSREVAAVEGKQMVERDAARPFAKEALVNCEVDLPGVLKKAVDVYDGPNGKGYVVVPDVEIPSAAYVGSPRLVHPEQAVDFKKEVVEGGLNGDL